MNTEDKSRKTEPATPHRLREARRKGHVVKSREITSSAIMLAAMGFFYLQWHDLVQRFEELMLLSLGLVDDAFADALARMLNLLASALYEIAIPFMLVVVAAGVVAHIAQFGFIVSFEPVNPKLARLDPVQGMKRIVSVYNLVETGKAALKTVIILAIVAFVLFTGLEALLRIPHCDLNCERGVLESLSGRVAIYLLPFVLVLAVADYVYQRRHFMREHRMSRAELRRERRDTDGAPEIASRRRQTHRETAATPDAASAVQRATVLVIGDDIAVALYYDRTATPLPVVSLIVNGDAARTAVSGALSHGVPVKQAPDLAESLAREVGEGDYIGRQHMRQTAELLSRLSVSKNR